MQPFAHPSVTKLHGKPVTVKIVCIILYSSEISLHYTCIACNTATHLTLTPDFSSIWLSGPGGCIGPTEPLAECQRHSPQGLVMHYRGSNPQPFDYWSSKSPLHHRSLNIRFSYFQHPVLLETTWQTVDVSNVERTLSVVTELLLVRPVLMTKYQILDQHPSTLVDLVCRIEIDNLITFKTNSTWRIHTI